MHDPEVIIVPVVFAIPARRLYRLGTRTGYGFAETRNGVDEAPCITVEVAEDITVNVHR